MISFDLTCYRYARIIFYMINREIKMNVTYFEHYPHMEGTINRTIKLDAVTFSMLITLAKDYLKKKNDDAGELLYVLIKDCGQQYALDNAFIDDKKRPKAIIKALQKRGYWIDQWEEGSFYFALPGFEHKAKKKLIKLEEKLEKTFLMMTN